MHEKGKLSNASNTSSRHSRAGKVTLDILHVIFEHLDVRTLTKVRSVNKAFADAASRHIFRTVYLADNRTQALPVLPKADARFVKRLFLTMLYEGSHRPALKRLLEDAPQFHNLQTLVIQTEKNGTRSLRPHRRYVLTRGLVSVNLDAKFQNLTRIRLDSLAMQRLGRGLLPTGKTIKYARLIFYIADLASCREPFTVFNLFSNPSAI